MLFTEPSERKTIPKSSIPRQAAAKTRFRLYAIISRVRALVRPLSREVLDDLFVFLPLGMIRIERQQALHVRGGVGGVIEKRVFQVGQLFEQLDSVREPTQALAQRLRGF